MKIHFAETPKMFVGSEMRQIPFVCRSKVVTKVGKEFEGTRGKRMFADNCPIKPVERIVSLNCPILFVGWLASGGQKFVMGGKVMLSPGNNGAGLWATQNCNSVSSRLYPGPLKCSPSGCHFSEFSPSFHSFKNPTITSRSLTLTGELFSIMKLNTLFDSPGWSGMTMQAFGTPLKIKNLLEKFVMVFSIPAKKKQSFVKSNVEGEEPLICRAGVKNGFGSGGGNSDFKIKKANKRKSKAINPQNNLAACLNPDCFA